MLYHSVIENLSMSINFEGYDYKVALQIQLKHFWLPFPHHYAFQEDYFTIQVAGYPDVKAEWGASHEQKPSDILAFGEHS